MIDVIVVTHDSADTIDSCLAGLAPTDRRSVRVTVVDTSSADDTCDRARAAGARVLRIPNDGFGTACNVGAAAADGDTLMFVNPDCVLTGRDLATLEAAIGRVEGTGVRAVACPAFSHVPPQRDEGFRLWFFPSARQVARLTRRPVVRASRFGQDLLTPARLNGAAFMVRRADFEAVGGFDERFFLYFEDTDLSLRLQDHGLELVTVPAAVADHARGHSTGRRADISAIQASSNILLVHERRGALAAALCLADLVITTLSFGAAELLTGRHREARRRLRRLPVLRDAWRRVRDGRPLHDKQPMGHDA